MHCTLTPDEFWELGWYEWMLFRMRAREARKQAFQAEEGEWSRWRILYAQVANALRGKHDKPQRPEDIIKLSFDKDTPAQTGGITLKEARTKLGSKFKLNGK